MTMTKGGSAKPPSPKPTTATPTAPAPGRVRRTPLPAAGPGAAPALERAPRARIGADVVCEAILRQDVDVFFSYPGGVILPLYDVLGDHPALRHILVRHEQGGAPGPDGY